MDIRCTIVKVRKHHYIGRDYNSKKYKIVKNKYMRNRKVGDDFYFYATLERGLFRDVLTPISDEEEFKLAYPNGRPDIHKSSSESFA